MRNGLPSGANLKSLKVSLQGGRWHSSGFGNNGKRNTVSIPYFPVSARLKKLPLSPKTNDLYWIEDHLGFRAHCNTSFEKNKKTPGFAPDFGIKINFMSLRE